MQHRAGMALAQQSRLREDAPHGPVKTIGVTTRTLRGARGNDRAATLTHFVLLRLLDDFGGLFLTSVWRVGRRDHSNYGCKLNACVSRRGIKNESTRCIPKARPPPSAIFPPSARPRGS